MSSEADVLHIDNDSHFLDIYQDFLSERGLEVHTCKNEERGFRAAKNKNPKLILLEVVLEDMNGYELLEELKQNGETNYIPVIVLSKLGQKRDLQKARDLNANGYIIKQHVKPRDVVRYIKQNFIK
ncbi:MAG: PleD family two-component system response regulator [Candidatus Magasanikbacteria bacterium]